MPGLDRTGPEGKGSRTGRGLGDCGENSEVNERAPKVPRRGRGRRPRDGRGRGFRRGRRNGRD